MGGNGRMRASKGSCCCDRKDVISELSFFCYQTRQSGPWSSVQKHCVYFLQLAVHTEQMNWICGLGRYLMPSCCRRRLRPAAPPLHSRGHLVLPRSWDRPLGLMGKYMGFDKNCPIFVINTSYILPLFLSDI